MQAAAERLGAAGLTSVRSSRFYRNPAWPPGSGPDFVNAVLRAETALAPDAALALLHRIEAEFGRERRQRWGPRVLDLDLLAMGGRVLPDAATLEAWIGLEAGLQRTEAPAELILPHPRMQDRAFVLLPLAEVAPGWRHPLSGQTAVEMLARLPQAEREAMKPL